MNAELPQIVLISEEIPNTLYAGGLLLFRLFGDWPVGKLTVAGPEVPGGARKLDCPYVEFKPIAVRIQRSRFLRFAWLVAILLRATPRGISTNSNTVVVTVMQTFAYYYAAYLFARRKELPLVLIIHDDPEDFERQPRLLRPFFRKLSARIYRFAKHRLCVSPQMKQLFQTRYGVPGEVFYPVRSANLHPRDVVESERLRRPNKLVMGYVGNVGYGYGERLDQLAPIVTKAGGIVRIYSRTPPRLEHERLIEYAGSFENVWTLVKQECDVVLLPYSVHPISHQQLYRSHFPSKLPEYLALGMPVIITGPEYATGVIWGLNNPKAAITVTHSDESQWSVTIHQLVASPKLRVELAHGAVLAGNRDFNPQKIHDGFRDILIGCANL